MSQFFRNTITALQSVALFFDNQKQVRELTHKERNVVKAVSKAIKAADKEPRDKPVSSLWKEYHFDIICGIHEHRTSKKELNDSVVLMHIETHGSAALYDLANELTNDFEKQYFGVVWGSEIDYYETMEKFLQEHLFYSDHEEA